MTETASTTISASDVESALLSAIHATAQGAEQHNVPAAKLACAEAAHRLAEAYQIVRRT